MLVYSNFVTAEVTTSADCRNATDLHVQEPVLFNHKIIKARSDYNFESLATCNCRLGCENEIFLSLTLRFLQQPIVLNLLLLVTVRFLNYSVERTFFWESPYPQEPYRRYVPVKSYFKRLDGRPGL